MPDLTKPELNKLLKYAKSFGKELEKKEIDPVTAKEMTLIFLQSAAREIIKDRK